MISIHAGLPKTGTTSLQKRIFKNASFLEAHGWRYPKEWISEHQYAHHSLSMAVINPDANGDDLLRRFIGSLNVASANNVFISSEGFTNCLQPKAIGRFIDFLEGCGSKSDVAMLLVLRRLDSFLESMYLHSTKVGRQKMDLELYIKNMDRWADNFFRGLSLISNKHPNVSLDYFRHSSGGDILENILHFMRLEDCLADFAEEKKADNIRLGAKAQSFLLFFDSMQHSIKITADRAKWIRAFESGKAIFPGEIFDYSLLSKEQSRHIRENSLRAAGEHGVSAYNDFFGSDVSCEREYLQLDPNKLLTDADIDWLQEMDSVIASEVARHD